MTGERFDQRQANFLAKYARKGRTVTYGEFAREFGFANQGCGPALTGMGIRLKRHGLPLLPVLVVSEKTGLPSDDAEFYRRLGLDKADLEREQQKCFAYDWTSAPFWSADE